MCIFGLFFTIKRRLDKSKTTNFFPKNWQLLDPLFREIENLHLTKKDDISVF